MRIIGLGNDHRGDDAAGLIAAHRLRRLGFDAREHRGDLLALLDQMIGTAELVIVDAVVTGAAPGAIHYWDGRRLPPEAVGTRSSTHSFSLGDAIRRAGSLDRLPARVRVIGIEAADFAALNPKVLAAVESVVASFRPSAPIPSGTPASGTCSRPRYS